MRQTRSSKENAVLLELPKCEPQFLEGASLVVLTAGDFSRLVQVAESSVESLQTPPQYLKSADGTTSHVVLTDDDYNNLIANCPDLDSLFYITMRRKGIGAVGMACFPESAMCVWRGSEVGRDVPSLQPQYRKLRQWLEEKQIIGRVDDGRMIFRRSYTFENPSTAARIITGDSASGNELWKDRKGKTLAERGFGTYR
jgi:hypothetical protein